MNKKEAGFHQCALEGEDNKRRASPAIPGERKGGGGALPRSVQLPPERKKGGDP